MIEMIFKDIIQSKLTPAEKAFLISEWILRRRKPYELATIKLADVLNEAEEFILRQLPPGFLTNALNQLRTLLRIKNQKPLFPLVIALAYYSYVHSEFIYDRETRRRLLSKISELGYKVQEVEKYYRKWTRVMGDDEVIFNKMLMKRSSNEK
jgi:hypothetical protein